MNKFCSARAKRRRENEILLESLFLPCIKKKFNHKNTENISNQVFISKVSSHLMIVVTK